MSGSVITMECLICGDLIRTSDVQQALAFDQHHVATCGDGAKP